MAALILYVHIQLDIHFTRYCWTFQRLHTI